MSTHNLVKSLRADRSQLAAENEKLRAEVERLRAEANARAVEELRRVQQWAMANCAEMIYHGRAFASTHMAVSCAQVKLMVEDRIAELSKPAAKESEPVPQEKQRRSFAFGNTSIENPRITPAMVDAEAEKLAKEGESVTGSEPAKDEQAKCWSCGGQGYITTASDIAGMVGYSQYSCSRCGGTGKLSEPAKPVTGPNYLDQEEWGHTKPEEEPDWTVTLAAQAKNPFARTDETLLALVVEALCNLGREVRRGGKS